MRASLHDDDLRARFVAHYGAHGVIAQAARACGVGLGAVAQRRRVDPEFAELFPPAHPSRFTLPAYQRATPARRRAFFEVLARTGNAAEASRVSGLGYMAAWRLKLNDADFAAAWADARAQALARVEDALFDGALNGFTRTETAGGVERVVRTRRPTAMFKLLEHAAKVGVSRYRVVELTPQAFAEAQVKIERHIRLATEARLASAGLPQPTVPAP